MMFSTLLKVAGLACLAAMGAACIVDTHDRPRPVLVDDGSGGGTGQLGGGSTTGNGTPSAYPILVDVDTNQTIDADPGKGVGVFTEYQAGGRWHVWWTCDTSINPQNSACPFDVKVNVATGAITAAAPDRMELADALSQSSPQNVEMMTTTSTGVDGVTFTTDPGAVVTLSASVGGQYDPGILFFVSKGSINGGYGAITDPLMLEGASP